MATLLNCSTKLFVCTYSIIFHYNSSIVTVTVNEMVINIFNDVDSCTYFLCCYCHVHRNQLTNHNEKYISHSVISRTFIDILALF